MKNIVICGFMGCGKTTLGKVMSNMMKLPFVDTDECIEQAEKMPISQIFEEKGEEYFRTIESNTIKQLSQKEGCIISVGGGSVLNKENVAVLKENCDIIFLDCDFETCYDRIKDSDRPIVKKMSKDELCNLFNQRRPIYESICTDKVNPADFMGE